jgi:uncharacterized protein (TIGR03086 family)
VTGGSALLDHAIGYALGAVSDVTPALYPRPTPCRGWNLEMLLRHVCESLTTLHSGIVTGHAGLIPAPGDPSLAMDPTLVLRARADQVRTARTAITGRHRVEIAGRPLPAVAVECAGALEIAIHGWDVSQACGYGRPIPDPLAAGLLAVAPLLIPETGRRPLFDAPFRTAVQAALSDQLVAFLVRRPSPRGSGGTAPPVAAGVRGGRLPPVKLSPA